MRAIKFGIDEVQNDNGREERDMRGLRSIGGKYSRTIISGKPISKKYLDNHKLSITGTTCRHSNCKKTTIMGKNVQKLRKEIDITRFCNK